MTSIRITKDVKYKITNKVKNLYENRIESAKSKLRTDFWDDAIEQIIEKEIKPFTENRTFPEEWIKSVNSITLSLPEQTDVYSIRLNKTYNVLNLAQFFPVTSFKLNEKNMPPALLKEYVEYQNNYKKIEDEQEVFIEEINNLFNKCNTLSQFLKVWPQGKELIKDLDFNTEKRTRRKRNIEVEESTINTLNSKLLKQTMLNS